MKSKKPNFLIAGVARCGTTSLYHYLRQHPQIYFGAKEPKFISSQFLKFPLMGPKDQQMVDGTYIKTWKEYLRLFNNSKDEIALGEASADTLYYYEKSIPIIKKYLGDPKIVIILRNPVERAFSAFTTLTLDNRETLSFEGALKKEQERVKENYEFIWHYTSVGIYYNSVKSFIENFSRVKVCLFDDLKEHPEKLVKEIYEFLGVNKKFNPIVGAKFASSGKIKSKKLKKIFQIIGPFENKVIKPLSKFFGVKDKLASVKAKVSSANLERPKMKDETRKRLISFFREDVTKLEKLIKKDLSNWLK